MLAIAPVEHLEQIDLSGGESFGELRLRLRQRLEPVGRGHGLRAERLEAGAGGDHDQEAVRRGSHASRPRRSSALPAADPEPVLSKTHQASDAHADSVTASARNCSIAYGEK
jgi:hypothetical protein